MPALNQEIILAAFQEDGWPAHIDDQLPPAAGVDAPVPAGLLHAIYALTEGNPFFIEEVLTVLGAERRLVVADGAQIIGNVILGSSDAPNKDWRVLEAGQAIFGFDSRPWAHTLDVPVGSRTCLMGRNGMGKTTLLKLMAGVLQPERGSVMLHHRPLLLMPAYPIGLVPKARRLLLSLPTCRIGFAAPTIMPRTFAKNTRCLPPRSCSRRAAGWVGRRADHAPEERASGS